MIIYHLKEYCNYIPIDSINLERFFNKFYSDVVSTINFNELICDKCCSSSWHYHAYYERSVIFHSHKISVRITRIICSVCGKTHAILIEPMIPYLYVLFDDLMNVILMNAFLFESSFCASLKHKFASCIIDYPHVVKHNSHKQSILFVPT